MRQHIAYLLPKSRTTQQLINGRNIDKAWSNVRRFIDHCTSAHSDKPDDIQLMSCSAPAHDENRDAAARIIAETKDLFGDGKSRPLSYSYPDQTPSNETITEWHLSSAILPKAIAYLQQSQPWPTLTFPPLELIINYRFKLADPINKQALPQQDENSSIMVWLSRSCCCSPYLSFPFVEANAAFVTYVKNIQPLLPFRLEEKYLRLAVPNKASTSYVLKKIAGKLLL